MPLLLKRPLFWIALLGLMAAGAGAILFLKPGQSEQVQALATSAPPPDYSAYTAVAYGQADVEGGIVAVSARHEGIVRDVLVEEGDLVVRDQILAQMDDETARQALSSGQTQLDRAGLLLAETQTRLDAARAELARVQAIAARGFATTQIVSAANDQVQTLEGEVMSQQAGIAIAETEVQEAQHNLDLAVIRSPVDGRVIRRLANPGAGTSGGSALPLFEIEPDAPRIVRTEVTQAAIAAIRPGTRAEIVLTDGSQTTFPAEVLRLGVLFGARRLPPVEAAGLPGDRVIEVVVSAGDAPLLIGQQVMVRFPKTLEAAP